MPNIRQMSGQVSRGSAGEYQADERAEKRITFSLAKLNSSMFWEGMVTKRMSAKLEEGEVA